MNERKKMIDAIGRIVIPVLQEYGFVGGVSYTQEEGE